MNIPSPEDLYKLAYVPGVWVCPKCGFILTKTSISMESGQFGTTEIDRQSEPCPNDGEWMNPQTWKNHAVGLAQGIDFWSLKAHELEAENAKLRKALEEANRDRLRTCIEAGGWVIHPYDDDGWSRAWYGRRTQEIEEFVFYGHRSDTWGVHDPGLASLLRYKDPPEYDTRYDQGLGPSEREKIFAWRERWMHDFTWEWRECDGLWSLQKQESTP